MMDRRGFLRLIAGSSFALAIEPLAQIENPSKVLYPAGSRIVFDLCNNDTCAITFLGVKRFPLPRNVISEPAATVEPKHSSWKS
jgi:hypothetical protein